MNIYQKFITMAKQQGLQEVEIAIYKTSSLGIEVYHKKIESFETNSNTVTLIRGIYNNHFGTAKCGQITKDNISKLILDLINNAKCIEKDEEAEIFKGSEKYHKVSSYNKSLADISLDDKKQMMFNLEEEIYKQSDIVKDAFNMQYNESTTEYTIINSYGLNLRQKSNNFMLIAGVVINDGSQEQNHYDYIFGNDFNAINIPDFSKKLVSDCISKLGAEPCQSKKMKVLLDRQVVSDFVYIYLGWADAEDVQKHVSLFEGKLNTKIASSKLTISDMPLKKTVFARWFDDEGVATYNKDIIKKGVLQTYLYNLETAKKDGVQSTGNGINTNSKMGVGPFFVYVKPGKKTLEQLCQRINNGIYITQLMGVGTGVSHTSGDFSIQAWGYLIENGKITKPITLITIAGNILTMFNDIVEIGGDSMITYDGICTPSMYIKSLTIAGK